jgi:hypothetical protein
LQLSWVMLCASKAFVHRCLLGCDVTQSARLFNYTAERCAIIGVAVNRVSTHNRVVSAGGLQHHFAPELIALVN